MDVLSFCRFLTKEANISKQVEKSIKINFDSNQGVESASKNVNTCSYVTIVVATTFLSYGM